MTNEMISALEAKGFRRWTKGNKDRLYINADALGLECDHYNTGNVSSARFNGERISNSRGRAMEHAKTYIDVTTGDVHSDNYTLECAAKDILEAVIDEIERNAKEEETVENRSFEVKAKIVKAGNSKVFMSWHEQAGITEEEFLDGLRWLCDDPMPNGRLSRELGCMRRADAGYTEDQLEIIGGTIAENPHAGLYRLRRAYDADGRFLGLYDETGHTWGGTADYASINARDRV